VDIQNLRAFMMVAEHASFSTAAVHLHLTQPAVSKRVASLEQQLGTALFDRIGRRVSLTEAGTALLPHARTIWQDLELAQQSITDLSGTVSGRLKLATSHHIGLHRLAPVLRRFSTNYPQVTLDIDFMDSEQAYEEILRVSVELAVVTLAPEQDANMLAQPIWPDPLAFMADKNHPLCGRASVSLQELSEHPVILPALNTYTGQIARELFDREGLQLNVAMSTNYLETIRMMASIGLGWTILPHSMLDDRLKTIHVPIEPLQRVLGYIYHRGRSLSNAAQAFIKELY